MDKSLFIARRKLQEDSSPDSSNTSPVSPNRLEDIASAFGGKVATKRSTQSKFGGKTIYKEEKKTVSNYDAPSHIPEDLVARLAARRQAVDTAIGKKEILKEPQHFKRDGDVQSSAFHVVQYVSIFKLTNFVKFTNRIYFFGMKHQALNLAHH
jgi:hypothetical protein